MNNKIIWKSNSAQSSYQFNNPNRMGYFTKGFMKYVKSAEKYELKATKQGFYKIMGKELVKGNMCTFFASIKDAGIVDLHKKWNGSYTEAWYTKGSNWNAYLEGKLERYHYVKHGAI